MTYSIGHYVLLVMIVGLPLSVVGLYLRAIRDDMRRFQTEAHERANLFEARLGKVERRKVSHDDWVRVTTSQQHSLEATRELVRELGGKLDATIGLGGSLKRLAEAAEKRVVTG